MRTLALFCLLSVVACRTNQQVITPDWEWTETKWERCNYGEERLFLTGKFLDADTVYIQVYHDGENAVDPIVAYGTFHMELGEFAQYEIVFTDTYNREKRISIHELGDRLIEWYPPMEIDFDRLGNYILIKPDAKLPQYAEIHVGMSRKAGTTLLH